MKITLGVPYATSICGETVAHIIHLLRATPTSLFNIGLFGGFSIPVNRTAIVNEALRNGSSHILFIDADMTDFSPKDFKMLLDDNKDIIGAPYNKKELPLCTTVLMKDAEGKTFHPKELPAEPFRAWAVPTGFMLLKTSVFEKLDRPFFWSGFAPPDFTQFMSEDVYFCDKAGKAGFEIWCESRIKIGHLGTYTY